jgi:type III pantothenate kinase
VDLVEPTDREIIAQDTVSAIQAGIVYGFAALTDGIAERLASRFPACPQCMATGGLAGVIIPHCRNISIIEPDLTLIGLYLIRTKYLKT